MQIVNDLALVRFARKHPDARPWLDTWRRTVEENDWTSLQHLRQTYPSADGVNVASGNVLTVFNVSGNKYRMICNIGYVSALMLVHEIMTHAEYSKDLWKERY